MDITIKYLKSHGYNGIWNENKCGCNIAMDYEMGVIVDWNLRVVEWKEVKGVNDGIISND